jgi:hypothetical protein
MVQDTASSHLQGLVWKAVLLGSAIGFVLQVMAVAAYYAILIKIWGQSPTLNLAPYWILVICSAVSIGMSIVIWLTFFYDCRTKSKKLDQDVDAPAAAVGSNSIPWPSTSRTLFVVGIYFLFGYNMGVDIAVLFMGQAVPWTHFLKKVGVNFVLSWIIIKCFDWVEHNNNKGGEEQKEEEETTHLYVPMIDPVIL